VGKLPHYITQEKLHNKDLFEHLFYHNCG